MAYAFLAKLKKKSTYDTDYDATKLNPNQTNTNSQNNITQQRKPRSQMLSWTGHGYYPLQSDPRWWHFCTDCGLQSEKKWSATMYLDLKRFLHLSCLFTFCAYPASARKKTALGWLPKRIVRSQDSLLQLQPNHSNLHLKQLAIDNSLYHAWIKGWEVMNPRDEVAQRLRWSNMFLLLKRWPSMTTTLTLNRINLEGQGVKRVNC